MHLPTSGPAITARKAEPGHCLRPQTCQHLSCARLTGQFSPWFPLSLLKRRRRTEHLSGLPLPLTPPIYAQRARGRARWLGHFLTVVRDYAWQEALPTHTSTTSRRQNVCGSGRSSYWRWRGWSKKSTFVEFYLNLTRSQNHNFDKILHEIDTPVHGTCGGMPPKNHAAHFL